MLNHDRAILQKLWEDPASREEFLSQPKAYLQKQGQEISEDTRVFAHQETPSKKYFVLPPNGTEVAQSENLKTEITRRALQDSAYKDLLFKNPQAAAQEMGIDLPDSITYTIVQNSQDEVHIVLPVSADDCELSDLDLELVAGGSEDKDESSSDDEWHFRRSISGRS